MPLFFASLMNKFTSVVIWSCAGVSPGLLYLYQLTYNFDLVILGDQMCRVLENPRSYTWCLKVGFLI